MALPAHLGHYSGLIDLIVEELVRKVQKKSTPDMFCADPVNSCGLDRANEKSQETRE